MGKPTIGFFLEDRAHEMLLTALTRRIAYEVGIEVDLVVENSRGGIPIMRGRLRRFLAEYVRLGVGLFDIMVIAEDTDCRGESTVKSELDQIVQRSGYIGATVIAAPAPHIECWYLADPVAIQTIADSTSLTAVPSGDCRKDLYKRQLAEAFPFAPRSGIEFAPEIVSDMDLYQAGRNVSSLGSFLRELRSELTRFGDTSQ